MLMQKDLRRDLKMVSDRSSCASGNGSDNLICLKSWSNISSDFCNVPYGSRVTRPRLYYGTSYEMVMDVPPILNGLTVQSPICSNVVSINISKHYAWINSVVFGRTFENETRVDEINIACNEFLHFRDKDLTLGDACFQLDGERGVCTRYQECKKKILGSFLLCTGGTICC